jgi:hypothetical protein
MKQIAYLIGLVIALLPLLSGKQLKSFQVFLLAGQSNMQGQGVVDMDHPKYYNGGRGNLVRVMQETNTPELYQHLKIKKGSGLKGRMRSFAIGISRE